MLTRFTKKYSDTVTLQGNELKVKISDEGKEIIAEYINNHTRIVTAYGSLNEWRVSVISTRYLQINPADAVGRVVNINYDTCEVEIELSEECNDPNSYRYINPKDYDAYELKLRGLYSRTAGEPMPEDATVRFIVFDLVKIK